jgi:hypothetical protein
MHGRTIEDPLVDKPTKEPFYDAYEVIKAPRAPTRT